jgi:hypothetical protein
MTKTSRITPCMSSFETVVRECHYQAEQSGDMNGAAVAYAILWFVSTGRAFTGFARACAHMRKGTVKALVRRIYKGMSMSASVRGSSAVVIGDLTNAILASALGYSDVANATNGTCGFEYGTAYVLG